MDEHGNLYTAPRMIRGRLQHSSFLCGRPVAGSGEIAVENGKIAAVGQGEIAAISSRSGHYEPPIGSFETGVAVLRSQGVEVPNAVFGFTDFP